jgi:hypothetical protein
LTSLDAPLDVPSSFADVVIMNFPLNHLNDDDALLSVKEVTAFAHIPSHLCCACCSMSALRVPGVARAQEQRRGVLWHAKQVISE